MFSHICMFNIIYLGTITTFVRTYRSAVVCPNSRATCASNVAHRFPQLCATKPLLGCSSPYSKWPSANTRMLFWGCSISAASARAVRRWQLQASIVRTNVMHCFGQTKTYIGKPVFCVFVCVCYVNAN